MSPSGRALASLAQVHAGRRIRRPHSAPAQRFAYRLRVTRGGAHARDRGSVPFSAGARRHWTCGCWPRAGTHGCMKSWARMPPRLDGVDGFAFAVWAPNASRVALVGDFNDWDGRRHPMRLRRECGVWELFLPDLSAGARYKYEIKDAGGALLPLKADPFAFATELRPATASIVSTPPARPGGRMQTRTCDACRRRRATGRCRSTKCTRVRGGAARTGAC